jgi:hypothetical protein
MANKTIGRQGHDTVERVTSAVKPGSCSNKDFDPQKIREFDHRSAILD